MKKIFFTIILNLFTFFAIAQMPVCDTGSTGFVYIKADRDIWQYNPVTDTTIKLTGIQVSAPNSFFEGAGLAVLPITNGFQTNYTWVSTMRDTFAGPITYATYDQGNSQWLIHGNIPTIGAVNLGGGCGSGIFNFDAGLGFVYNFDSLTSNNTPIVTNLKSTTTSGTNKNGMYDAVGDLDGNFYILITSTQAPVPRGLHKYDPSGNLLNTWNITGIHNSYGAGLAIVGGKVYTVSGNAGVWVGNLSGNTVNFTHWPNGFRGCFASAGQMGDFASCPNMPAFGSTITSLRPNCSGNQAPLSTSNYINNFEILGLSPNPALNKINLEINSAQNDELKIEIINLNGQTLLAKNFSINSGRNILKIVDLDFASGVYFLKTTNTKHKQFIRKISFR